MLELLSDGRMLVRAGHGVPEHHRGGIASAVSPGSQPAHVLEAYEVVLIQDLPGETRFEPAATLVEEGVRSGVKMPPEWLQSVVGSAKISKLGLPVIVPVAEFRDLVGAAVTATLSGADPATELKKANDQFRPILERSEKA